MLSGQILCKTDEFLAKRAQICDFDAEIIENRANLKENTHAWRQYGDDYMHHLPWPKIWGLGSPWDLRQVD